MSVQGMKLIAVKEDGTPLNNRTADEMVEYVSGCGGFSAKKIETKATRKDSDGKCQSRQWEVAIEPSTPDVDIISIINRQPIGMLDKSFDPKKAWYGMSFDGTVLADVKRKEIAVCFLSHRDA